MSNTQMSAQDFLAVRARLAAELDRRTGRSQVNTEHLAEGLLLTGFVDVEEVLRELYPDRYAGPPVAVLEGAPPIVPADYRGEPAWQADQRDAEPERLTLADVETAAVETAIELREGQCPNAFRTAPGVVVLCERSPGPNGHMGVHRDFDNTTRWNRADAGALRWQDGTGWVPVVPEAEESDADSEPYTYPIITDEKG